MAYDPSRPIADTKLSWRQVSEIDLISAYQNAEEIWQGYVSIFVSLVFAYIVVAYLVGAKLTRSQAAIVTGLYVLAGGVFILLLVVIFGRMLQIGSDISAINPERIGFAASDEEGRTSQSVILFTPFVGAHIAGLVFMTQVRRKAGMRKGQQSRG